MWRSVRDSQLRAGQAPGRGRTPAAPNYAMRRAVAAAVVVVTLVVVVVAVVSTGFWVRDTIRDQDARKAAAAAGTVYPVPTDCVLSALDVTVDAPVQVAVGAGLTAHLTATNRTGQACLLDVGGASLGMVLTSGAATMLDSSVCPAEPASRRLLLDDGEQAAVDVTWNGMIAQSSCLPAQQPAGQGQASGAEDATAAPEDGSDGDDGGAGQQTDGSGATDVQAAGAQAASPGHGAGGSAGDGSASGASGPSGTDTQGASGSVDAGGQGGAGDAAGADGSGDSTGQAGTSTTADTSPTAVTVTGNGGYARSGTYTFWLTLAGQRVGIERPLVIGRG